MPVAADRWVLSIILLGLTALYGPTIWDWSQGHWEGETHGHELLIVAISFWLLFRKREHLGAIRPALSPASGGVLLSLGLLLYVLGRTQQALRIELLSLIVVTAGLLVCFKGRAVLRVAWFPLLFMLFALPIPFPLAMALTAPMKTVVSIAATHLLSWLGYSAGRAGVVITIGQYQLLVTEACAGLQTMFALEAMGLLYTNLMSHQSALRNALLAMAVAPIAFCANVVRVLSLALVTYHFGDAAGQGFLHGFAGMILFMVALALIMVLDGRLGAMLARQRPAR